MCVVKTIICNVWIIYCEQRFLGGLGIGLTQQNLGSSPNETHINPGITAATKVPLSVGISVNEIGLIFWRGAAVVLKGHLTCKAKDFACQYFLQGQQHTTWTD